MHTVDLLNSDLATKADLDQAKTELNAKINETRTELNAKINETRAELNAKIDAKPSLFHILIGFAAINGVTVALAFGIVTLVQQAAS